MSILADSSVWIEHFRKGSQAMVRRLEAGEIVIHPFVAGELACGSLRNRAQILTWLTHLPSVGVVSDAEAMRFVEARRLFSRGLGWVDVHLLAGCLLTGVRLWTLDKALRDCAREMGVAGD